ncbi:MAG: Bax inhibitor-1/YccA family protein [Candidatus Izemoplasmatales bacterium]
MRMRSSNPVLNHANSYTMISDQPLTYTNVTVKTLFLLALTAISAFLTIVYMENVQIWHLIVAAIVAFISVLIGSRSVKLSPYFSIVYAACEGLVLGVVSLLYASLYEGIILTAIATTIIVFVVMLLLFSTNIIKVNQKFASFLVVALIGVIIMSLISIFVSIGDLYYLVVIASAALSAFFLLWDFQRIKELVDNGADKELGWILSLGLMVTIVWIYIEMLRLLAIFSRD